MKRDKEEVFLNILKRDTVALVTEQVYKLSETTCRLDIYENVLRKWKQKFEQHASGEALNLDEHEELKRLQRENHELRMENKS